MGASCGPAYWALKYAEERGYPMPWNPAQHRLFEAAAHSPEVAKRVGIPMGQAKKMAGEGIKHDPKKVAEALKNG